MSHPERSQQSDAVAPTTGRWRNVAFWCLQVLLSATFLMAGGSKLAGAKEQVEVFEQIGLGQWFRYLTGGLEVLGAIALVIPRLAGLGALVIMCVMVGAIATHLFRIGGNPMPAIILLLLALPVAWGRLLGKPQQ